MKKRLDFWDIVLRVMYTFIGLGVLIGLFIAMRVYVVDQFVIPTDSMRPTLIPGDYVIVNKLIAGARIYDRLLEMCCPVFFTWISRMAIRWNATVPEGFEKLTTMIL